MKHAGLAALDTLEPLLAQIRRREALREKTRGAFYRRGKAWLHFHEDPAGLFADLKLDADWVRLRVSDEPERLMLLAAIDQALGGC